MVGDTTATAAAQSHYGALFMLSKWIGGGGREYFNVVWQSVISSQAQSEFRSNPHYNGVLEHLSKETGDQYLALIEDKDILEILRESQAADTVGAPVTFDFLGSKLSATTVRYAKVLQDLKRMFPHLDDFRSIAEIGIGYGGQARIISEYCKLKRTALDRYTFVDILPVTILAHSYLDNFNIYPACEYATKSQIGRDRRWDLAISNYAFSEFDRDLQVEYFEKVLAKSSNGYLIMNTGLEGHHWQDSGVFTARELLKRLPNAVIISEVPSTASTNYVIVYGDHSLDRGEGIEAFLNRR